MAGPHVFEDGRYGCWIVNLDALAGRLAALRGLGFTDLFLRGPDGTRGLKADVLEAGFLGCHAWWAVDGLSAAQYAERVLADVARWGPGAGDLNIELATDTALEPYMRAVVSRIRPARRAYRLRLNVAARKGGFVPGDLVASDPQLYACEQVYGDREDLAMSLWFSEADALERLTEAGVPAEKAAICFAGALRIGYRSWPGIPNGWTPRRGVVFHDDLLAEVGLI